MPGQVIEHYPSTNTNPFRSYRLVANSGFQTANNAGTVAASSFRRRRQLLTVSGAGALSTTGAVAVTWRGEKGRHYRGRIRVFMGYGTYTDNRASLPEATGITDVVFLGWMSAKSGNSGTITAGGASFSNKRPADTASIRYKGWNYSVFPVTAAQANTIWDGVLKWQLIFRPETSVQGFEVEDVAIINSQ